MPYRWVALPPTMKHGPESENGLRICYISVFKKNRRPRIVIRFNYSLHKKVPVPIQQTHRITEKDSLKHIQFRRTSTGSGLFASLGSALVQIKISGKSSLKEKRNLTI